MKKKSDAHNALSLIFQRMGVPDKMIVDGSKGQVLSNLQKKIPEAGCQEPARNGRRLAGRFVFSGNTRAQPGRG